MRFQGVPNFSKNTIRQTLMDGGIAVRDFSCRQHKAKDLTQVMRSGNTPYGYCYLEGKLVMDPHDNYDFPSRRRL